MARRRGRRKGQKKKLKPLEREPIANIRAFRKSMEIMHDLKIDSDDIKEIVDKETDTVSKRTIEKKKLHNDFNEL